MTELTGLRIVSERDTGDAICTRIAIVEGRESEAAETLLRYLRYGAEITLRNADLDEEQEGAVSFLHTWFGYYSLEGGHHWQGEWKRIPRTVILGTMISLARFNRGQHATDVGYIERKKRWGSIGVIFPTRPLRTLEPPDSDGKERRDD